MNRDALYYLERLDAFEIMETHIMDRVMQDYWQGNLDAGGSFLATSTAYGIINQSRGKKEDFEYDNRFYKARDLSRIQPHRFGYMVVRNSMQTRYFLEMVFYFALMCIFQFQLTKFIDAFNTVLLNSEEAIEATLILIQQKERKQIS